MIFKLFFRVTKPISSKAFSNETLCRVVSVENGQQLERRIASISSGFLVEGYVEAQLVNCCNISGNDPA